LESTAREGKGPEREREAGREEGRDSQTGVKYENKRTHH